VKKSRILIIADVPNWAWAKKAAQLQKYLGGPDGEFVVDVAYTTAQPVELGYDLYHTFEVSQVHQIPKNIDLWPGTPEKHRAVTGITAHVWPTWEARHGAGTVRGWASRAQGFHANSRLLQKEISAYLGHEVYYVPNGVDETFYRRLRPRAHDQRLVVGHVGKPNPRKGRDLIAAACERAGVEFREIRRTSKDALTAEDMREFYQDLHVLAVASDMDGTPNPALEAAACECAVVSNAIGNMPEFVESGCNGVLVERSVESLSAAFADLKRSVEGVVQMGRAARDTIERDWTWKKLSCNYADMWREVLGK
jgi:glycosyltransferase involved in cell wall biosynthesis